MKFLLILVLTGLSFHVNADDVRSISLIIPTSYQKPVTKISNLTGFAGTMTSQLYTATINTFKISILKQVNSRLEEYREDLLKYFSDPAELDSLISSIVQEGTDTYLTQTTVDSNGKEIKKFKATDDGMIRFYGFLGNKLIGKLGDIILDKEGVTDPARRNVWLQKIISPFNECMMPTLNWKFAAGYCLDALTDSFVPNLGTAMVYELSLSNLNSVIPVETRSSFNLTQVELYKSCLSTTKPEPKNVVACALSSMRKGVSKVTDYALLKKINEKTSIITSIQIKKAVWQAFEACNSKVGTNPANPEHYSNQFLGCIDSLIGDTGALVVMDKISNNAAINSVLSPEQIKKLAQAKSTQFKQCTNSLMRRGTRVGGILDISSCEDNITNEITYNVVTETFKSKAREFSNNRPEVASLLSEKGIQTLNRCWNSTQSSERRENCLRKTIVYFSQEMAIAKLNDVVPETTANKSQLVTTSAADLGKCMEEELPENITEADNLNYKIDGCTGKLSRKVALIVADYQIRSAATGNITKKATDDLIAELVNKKFAACIGSSPTDAILTECGDDLTITAAKKISEVSFEKEVYAYLSKAGGVNALGITNAQVKTFLSDLISANHQCVDAKAETIIMDHVNSCIKNSIKKIAFFFGENQFNKQAGSMYAGREKEKTIVETVFKKTLSTCLDTKVDKQFSINDYTKNLYTCADKVSSSTILTVAQDQVVSSLEIYMKDRPGLDLSAKRKALKDILLTSFKNCLKNGNESKCIDNLKREATRAVVLEYSRAEVKIQINAEKTPPELKAVEDTFAVCTSSKLQGDELTTSLDQCTKNFALDFAKTLGALKLTYLLKQTLGSADYNAQKKEIDESINAYNDCLEALEKYTINNGLTDRLTVCTDKLTNQGVALVRSSINTWMTTEEKDAATVLIKYEFANFLPCLSLLLPVSPYNDQLKDNVDSSVKPLAIFLAHYIEYNPESAHQTLDTIIKRLSIDFNDVASTNQAKADLLDFLYSSGALDQFIKAMVRGTVKDTLKDISAKEVSNDLKEVLLRKKTYEDIFDSEEGKRMKSAVMEKLLKPALLRNEDVHGVVFNANLDAIRANVVKMLIDSPAFGEQAIKMSVQAQINGIGGITRFFAKTLYSGDALQWENVRLTKKGKDAETYIKENVLLPRFNGVIQSKEEKKKINSKAEELVKKAIKSYDKN